MVPTVSNRDIVQRSIPQILSQDMTTLIVEMTLHKSQRNREPSKLQGVKRHSKCNRTQHLKGGICLVLCSRLAGLRVLNLRIRKLT